MKNADDITADSMAASCVKDGRLIVNADGTADVTIGLQAVSVFGVTAWAEQWKTYKEKDTEDANKETAEYTTNEEGNVGGITFDQGRFSADCFAKVYWTAYRDCQDKTVILVSHRKSTMSLTDVVFEMEKGRTEWIQIHQR